MICFVIALYYTAVIAWAVSFFVFSFDLRWGDDPAAFFTGDYLRLADPGVSLEFAPVVLVPLVAVWVVMIVVLALGVAKGVQRANTVCRLLVSWRSRCSWCARCSSRARRTG